jgi:prevent-host-death family protein
MLSVGVRELRQRASELLRQVEKGENIEITDRGRPVALLSPLPTGSPYRQLVAQGEIDRAICDLDDLPEPLPLPPGQESASSVLARLRADER